uniref:Uncharacterized protein n=1 Tax=uncultured marine virus TaxID=186617 RepID=A0A0F7L0Y1_9VIRU|nr:hypothetical protein [uncultured marine virus]
MLILAYQLHELLPLCSQARALEAFHLQQSIQALIDLTQALQLLAHNQALN